MKELKELNIILLTMVVVLATLVATTSFFGNRIIKVDTLALGDNTTMEIINAVDITWESYYNATRTTNWVENGCLCHNETRTGEVMYCNVTIPDCPVKVDLGDGYYIWNYTCNSYNFYRIGESTIHYFYYDVGLGCKKEMSTIDYCGMHEWSKVVYRNETYNEKVCE